MKPKPRRTKPAATKPKPKRASRGLRLFPSMANAAAALGIGLESLKIAKRAGCPAFSARGSVNERILLDWLKANPNFTQGSTISTKGLIDLEVLRRHRRINDVAEQKLIDRALVAGCIERTVLEAVGICRQKLEMEYPALCVGLDMTGLRAKGKQLHDEIVSKWRELAKLWPEGV